MDMRCRITSGGGDPRESATENRPPRPGPSGKVPAVRVKRCGKSAPRLRQRKRHGKPHREQNRIGTVWNASVAPAAAVFQDRCPDPAVRVGCSKRRATGVPEEWPSRVRLRLAPYRTRLTGRLIREGGLAPQRAGPPPVSEDRCQMTKDHFLSVTRGLDPRVHLLRMKMDCRVKPGNDVERMSAE